MISQADEPGLFSQSSSTKFLGSAMIVYPFSWRVLNLSSALPAVMSLESIPMVAPSL